MEEFPTPYIRDMVREFRERLSELEPYVDEYRRLEIAERALDPEKGINEVGLLRN